MINEVCRMIITLMLASVVTAGTAILIPLVLVVGLFQSLYRAIHSLLWGPRRG